MKKEACIIYIAGYGRSGSTLLEKILSCHSSILGVGELANFLKCYGTNTFICSCGKTLETCSFWNCVAKALSSCGYTEKNYSRYAQWQEREEAFLTHGGRKLFCSSGFTGQYLSLLNSIFSSIVLNANPEASFLIDSSKTAYSSCYRPLAIKELNHNLRIIHIVRDIRGVAWSVKKGLNRRMERGDNHSVILPVFRAVMGWNFGNRFASKLSRKMGKKNYYLLKYEDLVENPERILTKLETFLELDLTDIKSIVKEALAKAGVHLDLTHQIAGNRMRFQSNLVITPDYSWESNLPESTAFLVKKLSMPLMKKYGYT